MQHRLKHMITLVALVLLAGNAFAAVDGTREGAVPSGLAPVDNGTVARTPESITLNPIESVSISESNVWPDNRHRAYYNTTPGYINGFLLFDVSAVPDDAVILEMSILCYLENDYGSPNSNPVVDIYYSGDDGWTRDSATPGSLSLDVLLLDDVPFDIYVPTYDFVLDATAHDWAGDLVDDQICLGFTNDVDHYSFVYFFGAGGSPQGPPPELTIVYDTEVATQASTWSQLKALFR